MLTRVSQLMDELYFVVLALGQLGGRDNKDIEICLNHLNIRDLKHSPYSFCLLCNFIEELLKRILR